MSDATTDTLEYQPKRHRSRRKAYFWRATRYLRPYRRLVIVSVVCAFLAGGVFAGGITAALPVLQTLLNGDTPQMWVDRMIAEKRWGMQIAADPGTVRTEIFHGAPNGWGWGSSTGDLAAHLQRSPGETLRLLATGSRQQIVREFEANATQVQVAVPDGGSGLVPQHWGRAEAEVPAYLRALRRLIYLLPTSPVGAIAAIMGAIFLLAILANFIRFLQEYLSGQAALGAVNDVRRDLYDHVLRVSMGYFGKTGTGDVTSRIVHDAAQLQQGFTTLLGPAVQQPILAFFAFIVAMVVDWRLTLLVIAFAPIMAIVLRRFSKKMRRASRAALENNAELLGQIESTLAGIRVVKANNAEDHESNRLRRVLDVLLRYQVKLQKYDAASSPTMEALATGAVGVIVVVMVYFVREQQSLSAAGALLIFGCLAQMADSMRRISKLNVVLQKSNTAAARIFETIDLPGESAFPSPSGHPAGGLATLARRERELPSFEREIAFDGVRFAYAPDLPPALDGVSLAVRKGESVAVVGRNGSGKTTLLSLLPRFFDPDVGRVLIDGVDVRDVALESLRRQIGVVTQEAIVFPGTIAENIAYARTKATREQIEAAARQAEAHDFILGKPLGYDAPLAGQGGGLSGGQRQRLNIARAILRDPPILILDEATSQVDAESEHLIQQAIHRLMQGRTVFVIAHRFSTILDCDRIALMEQGRLVALGTHAELLDTSDLYRQLYDRQLVGV